MTETLPGLEAVSLPPQDEIEVLAEDEQLALISTHHNSIYIDPTSECSALVEASINKRQRGNLSAECSQGHKVQLCVTQALVALRRL